MNKNDWYDAMRYGLYEYTKQLIEEQVKEAVNIHEILKEERMNKVDKLTMCLKDLAGRYNLKMEASYNSMEDKLIVYYERFNYQTRNTERKKYLFTEKAYNDIKRTLDTTERELVRYFNLKQMSSIYLPVIKDVIFNDPATIVFWEDGTKTVVKAQDETFDPEKGLAMAISKKALGNQDNYCNEFKKWIPEEKEKYKIIDEISVPGSLTSNKLIDAVTAAAESISLKVKKGVEI